MSTARPRGESEPRRGVGGPLKLAGLLVAVAAGLDAVLTVFMLQAKPMTPTLGVQETADAAVVFFGGWNDETRRRVDAAVALQRTGRVREVVMVGGCRPESHKLGARDMAAWAVEAGVAREHVRFDECSFDTQSNIIAAAAMSRRENWRNVVFVSDALHLRRIETLARNAFDEGITLRVEITAYKNVFEAIWRAQYELIVAILPEGVERALARRLREQPAGAS